MNCGTCIYNKRTRDSHNNTVYMCSNEESERYGDYTGYNDSCEEWDDFTDKRKLVNDLDKK